MSITSGTGEFATRAIHAGYDPADYGHAAVPPIYASAAFDLENAQRGDALAGGLIDGFEYSRVANPTVDVLEKRLAALEGGIGAVAVGSGMAAVSYALMCVGEGGGRIIAPSNLYGASVDALGDFLPQFGIHTDFVKHINDLAEVESKIGPDTRAIFAETVANPSTEILDIEPLSQLAHEHGIALIVDNTVPTPYLLRPIEFGADIVVHSTTKGITGHGNAIGGAVIDGGHLDWANGRFPNSPHGSRSSAMIATVNGTVLPKDTATEAFIKRIRIKYLRTFGAVASPFNAYLSLIGLETLPQRVSQQVASAQRIAEHLNHAAHVMKVNYSGLGYTPQYELVGKYFPRGVGQILSFLVDGSADNVRRIIDGATVFSYVPNIGDARSLIVDPARITHREVPLDARIAAGVSDNLIRLSIGLENVDDLIADLDQAIANAY